MYNIIYNNDTYIVVVADDVAVENGDVPRKGYALINKHTGVREYEDFMLPAILSMSDHMDSLMERFQLEDEEYKNGTGTSTIN